MPGTGLPNLQSARPICDNRGMQKFRWIDDVENWLRPMNYEQFWCEIRPHCLSMHTRSECDNDIAHGAAAADVLVVMKAVAAKLIARRHKLKRKPATPWLKVVSTEE